MAEQSRPGRHEGPEGSHLGWRGAVQNAGDRIMRNLAIAHAVADLVSVADPEMLCEHK